MKSYTVRITPNANMVKRIPHAGSVVVCLSGAWQSYRIHWTKPQPGGIGLNNEDRTLQSEQLVNGEAYVAPEGNFREFYITTGPGLSSPVEDIELRVIDAALPVVVLNSRRFDGFRTHTMAQQALSLTHPITQTIYTTSAQENDPAFGEIRLTSRGQTIPRGWIAGGFWASTPVIVRAYANLDASSVNEWAEIARWFADSADGKGKFSASFEQGARTVFNGTGTYTYNGPGLVAWPARGLQLTIETVSADATGYLWLASRTAL